MNDVIIIGGGPAGLTLGCYLARQGVPVLIVEKALHPRPHVGESFMPATVRTLREIGFHEVAEAGHFPRSGGVVYHPGPDERVAVSYGEFPQEGVDQTHTYHADRAKFDMLLMKHAETCGCRIIQGVPVRSVLFDDDGRARGVRVGVGGSDVDLPASVVVDAAGRSTLIGRQLGIRGAHPVLDRFALHAWLEGVDRGPTATARYTHVHLLPEIDGWAWRAAIDDDITSVGVVADKRAYQRTGLDPDDFFDHVLRRTPTLAPSCREARRLNQLKGEINYSYALERLCGDGWLAIGDAAQFIDPIFSSGVSVAMRTARAAAERIQAALESGDSSRAAFLPYEETVQHGTAVWDEFVQLFYRHPRTLLGRMRSPEHRPGILRLLQGDHDADSHRTLETLRQAVEG